MANYAWNELFPLRRCEYLRYEGSDHMPFITILDDSRVKKKRLIHFDRRLREMEGVREVIEAAWKKEKEGESCLQNLQMPLRAPRPDGFSAGFYQSFWEIIGDDICRKIRIFFTSRSMESRLNETHVCLLPKGTDRRKPSEYRPISAAKSLQKY